MNKRLYCLKLLLALLCSGIAGCVNWPIKCGEKEYLDVLKTSTQYYYYCRARPPETTNESNSKHKS